MKRLVAMTLAMLLLAFCFVGCASTGPKMMKLGDSKITLNLFYLYLSRMKGTYCATYGISATDDAHWDTVMDETGKTYNEHYTEFVLEQTKSYLAACHVFDELGLELPDTTVDEIEAEIESMIENEAGGSEKEMNQKLAEFGANVDVLREAYLIEAKIAYLKDHLYGANGGKIGGEAIEKYYPDAELWETHTPYFERRNIHFYVNKCGFRIVEFFSEYHREKHDLTEEFKDVKSSGFFRFEKIVKR